VCRCRCGTVVVVELLSSWNYASWAVVGAELLLLSDYRRRGSRHVCAAVDVELVMSWD